VAKQLWVSSAMALLLNGCTVGTEYESPKTDVRPEWNSLSSLAKLKDSASTVHMATEPEETDQTKNRWQGFADPTLLALIDKGMTGNTDISMAKAQLEELQADRRNAFAAFFPEINGTATATHGELGTLQENQVDSAQVGMIGSWDIDLFGGNKRRYEAAEAAVQATEATLQDIQLSLLTDIATNYVQLRSLQKQETITYKNLHLQRTNLDITQKRRAEGVSTDMEVARANAQVHSTAARLPQIEANKTAVINRLSVLTASEPNDIRAMSVQIEPIPSVPKEAVVATPIEVIAKRPDVRAAERRLAQAASLSNAAFTEFFPKLTLEGFFGARNSDSGSSSPWGAAISGLVPLLNFGAISSQVDAANARQQQAFFGYQKAVLEALEETEVALSNYVNEIKRHKSLVIAANQQSEVAGLASEQYEAGVIDQLDLLIAEENQLNAENDAVLSEVAVAQNLVLLYRALGKDWMKEIPIFELPSPTESSEIKPL
jgi:NodT family efflux transporter outer membrane factor (OMF) lipoprotein